MTDKVQKIREEVARIQAYTQSDVLKEVLDYIDKVQEEPKPKFKIGDCIKPIESSLGSPRTICEVCDSWYITNQGTLDFEFEDNWELAEEPVSEELEKVVEEIVDPTVLNAYGVKEIANRLRRTMIEPVSEELEEAAKEWLRPQLDKSYANYGEVKMMELTHFDGYAMLDAIEAGAQWQKKRDYIQLSDDINEVARQICNKVLNCEIDYKEDDIVLSDEEECVKAGIRWQMQKESIPSKDLEELINSLSKQFLEVSFAKLSRIAVRVAKWQKEQMMAKAIDGDITFDYYGDDDKTYGCIAHNSFCLEDFGLKDRDKVKVIVIGSVYDTNHTKKEDNPILDKKLVDCGLSVRALGVCKHNDIETLRGLTQISKVDFLKLRNCGKTTLAEVDDLLQKYNLNWKPTL